MPTPEQLSAMRGKRSPEEMLLDNVMPQDSKPDPAPETDEIRKQRELERLKELTVDFITSGKDYRDKFKKTWDEIIAQVRQEPPAAWQKKEDWQSKVYVGLQAKTSETVFANLNAMLFPTERFFEIRGVEKRDKEVEGALEDLFQALFERGGLYQEKDFVVEESGNIGTGFIKIVPRDTKDGLDYVWRSPYQCLVDGTCGPNWRRQRFWVDQYSKDIYWLMDEIRKGQLRSNYNTDMLKGALAKMESEGHGRKDEELEVVRNLDGTGQIKIPKAYKDNTLNECWGLYPMPINPMDESQGYLLKHMVVTMLGEDFVVRVEENPLGFIPAIPVKTKPRPYDYYGLGYLHNGRGTQDLMNSMVNLAFDSAKINSFDIIVVDEGRIADPSSIQYRPIAVWKVKGDPRTAVLMTRHNGQSAMSDMLNGLSLLDRMHQDTVGVTRHSDGSPTLDGKEGEQTLGEYQLKMQAVDKRFLSVARRIEQDAIKALLEYTYRAVRNPAVFSQEACDRILGMVTIQIPNPADPMQAPIPLERPKLVLETLSDKTEMSWDFRGSGVSQFSERQKTLERLIKALEMAMQHPTLTAMTNLDVLWRRIFKDSEIPDWDEIVKSPEQMAQMLDFVQSLGAGVPVGAPLDNPGLPAEIPTKVAK